MISVTFEGGPCDQKVQLVAATSVNSGQVPCGGIFYTVLSRTATSAVVGAPSTPTPAGNSTVDATRGWADLRHVVSTTLPTELHQANVILRGALRELRRVRVR